MKWRRSVIPKDLRSSLKVESGGLLRFEGKGSWVESVSWRLKSRFPPTKKRLITLQTIRNWLPSPSRSPAPPACFVWMMSIVSIGWPERFSDYPHITPRIYTPHDLYPFARPQVSPDRFNDFIPGVWIASHNLYNLESSFEEDTLTSVRVRVGGCHYSDGQDCRSRYQGLDNISHTANSLNIGYNTSAHTSL